MTPATVNRQFVLTKCAFFLQVQIWPLHQKMNPELWLSNFNADEMPHALALLNAFVYFSQEMMEALFLSAFQSLSATMRPDNEPFVATQAKWRQFVDTVIFTCVRGEHPNVTDSGFHFLRMARQTLKIEQSRILEPASALELMVRDGPRPIVFVDDFVGSGRQFVTTWRREIGILSARQTISFERYAKSVRGTQFLYCPLICTQFGRDAITKACPEVLLCPAHVLSRDYSAFASDSNVWPPSLAPSAQSFIETASARAGIAPADVRGFNNLGLSLAFEHSVPDATLPIFYWNENGWKPLIERR